MNIAYIMENTSELMTNERIQALVAKRVFGLFYNDEWSGLIFSIRRVHSIKQFTYVETNKELVSKRLLQMGQEYLFESKRVIFLAGGSYDHCHKYFDLNSDFYFKFGPQYSNRILVLGYLIDRKQLARLTQNAKIIGTNRSTNEKCLI
jgi:hypothetical protein